MAAGPTLSPRPPTLRPARSLGVRVLFLMLVLLSCAAAASVVVVHVRLRDEARLTDSEIGQAVLSARLMHHAASINRLEFRLTVAPDRYRETADAIHAARRRFGDDLALVRARLPDRYRDRLEDIAYAYQVYENDLMHTLRQASAASGAESAPAMLAALRAASQSSEISARELEGVIRQVSDTVLADGAAAREQRLDFLGWWSVGAVLVAGLAFVIALIVAVTPAYSPVPSDDSAPRP